MPDECPRIDCCTPAYDSPQIEPDTGNFLLQINIDPEDSGTSEGAGEFEEMSDVTVTATPNTDWAFLGWFDLFDNLLSADSEYTFQLNGNMIIVAKFVAD